MVDTNFHSGGAPVDYSSPITFSQTQTIFTNISSCIWCRYVYYRRKWCCVKYWAAIILVIYLITIGWKKKRKKSKKLKRSNKSRLSSKSRKSRSKSKS